MARDSSSVEGSARQADPPSDILVRHGFFSPDEQRLAIKTVLYITPGFYIPRTRWGQAMNLRMNCLGQHWSAKSYTYSPFRIDVDGLPCAPIPAELQTLAHRTLLETGYLASSDVRPFDVCIVNFYGESTGKLGDHVDNSESPAALASGYPIVSISLGASCVFRIGGLAKTDPYQKHILASGDVVIFGRSKRMAYHGVRKILPGTMPMDLGLPEPCRINLTFRVL